MKSEKQIIILKCKNKRLCNGGGEKVGKTVTTKNMPSTHHMMAVVGFKRLEEGEDIRRI